MAAENSPSTPCSPLANTKPNTAVIVFPPFAHLPRTLPSAPKGSPDYGRRGGRFRTCCFPRLGFPPCTPPSEAPPFKRNTARGETHPSSCRLFEIGIRRRFAGGQQHGFFFVLLTPPLPPALPFASSGRACGCGCPEPLRRSTSPQPPGLGGRVGLRTARLQRTRPQTSKESPSAISFIEPTPYPQQHQQSGNPSAHYPFITLRCNATDPI